MVQKSILMKLYTNSLRKVVFKKVLFFPIADHNCFMTTVKQLFAPFSAVCVHVNKRMMAQCDVDINDFHFPVFVPTRSHCPTSIN